MAGGVTLCLFCLENSCTVRRDKYGRPFLYCWKCRVRTFLYEDIQLRSYFACVRAIYEKIGKVRAEYESEAEQIVAGEGLGPGDPAAIMPEADVPREVRANVKSG
jgi:hypothetical protein